MVLSLPSLLSYLRILLAPVFILCLIKGEIYLLWAIVIFTLAALTDYYDGYFARRLNLVSKYGMFIDPLADKVLVLSAFFMFYIYNIIDLWMIFIIVGRDIFVTGMRIFFVKKGAVLITSTLGKWKTAMQFFLIYLILCGMCYYYFTGIKNTYEITYALSHFRLITIIIHATVWFTLYSGLHYLITNRKTIAKWFL